MQRGSASVPHDVRDRVSLACNVGRSLLEVGALDDAAAAFKSAIELEPDNGSLYLALVTATLGAIDGRRLAAMIALSQRGETLSPSRRIDLHFALGQALEHCGRHADAFTHLRVGNELKRATLRYDEANELSFLEATLTALANPFFERARGCGNDSERPIFIVGMPRSGSTLVEQVLAGHPAVDAAGELGILGPIVREVWPTIRASTMDQLRAALRGIGERYLRATDALAVSGTRLTDKTLFNFGFAPLIHVMLPNARLIHIRRDALDTCFSAYATNFGKSQVPFSYDLGELGRYYRMYDRMMHRWRGFIPQDRLLEVSYEQLVQNFPAEVERIVAFCGLPWEPACLAFDRLERPVLTASSAQVRQPLFATSIGRAKGFLADLGPLVEALGG